MNREAWLIDAVDALRPLFAEQGHTVPEKVRVSVGWPRGRQGSKNVAIGQCFPTSMAADNSHNLFISPLLGDAPTVLATLVHELVHAIDDCKSKHQGDFIKIARSVGLTGKWTATVAGDELAARLLEIAETLGEYPHAAVNPNAGPGIKKQSTRMLKVECPTGSGYIARLTQKWLDEYGAPICPCCHEQMEQA